MLDYKLKIDAKTKKTSIETKLMGDQLLNAPQLNKGTAFTNDERHEFNLLGKLPTRVETIEQQVVRAYEQYCFYQTKEQKNIFLYELHNTNEILFYKLVEEHIEEMLPIVYTPHVATAVQKFSNQFRQARGLYISYSDRSHLDKILDNRTNPEIDLIVVTDGERILGIGDQGVGGMQIPTAKLMLYSLLGGVNPLKTLPIILDVGTNNQTLLNDPLYLGWHHPRLAGEEYANFIDDFVNAVKRKFSHIYLHWEDFGRDNAAPILERYRSQICSFNDDIQGTAVVTLTALLTALKKTKQKITDQRIVILGAGSAATGIADLICMMMTHEGISMEEARSKFWLLNSKGLITDQTQKTTPSQKPYIRNSNELKNWQVKNGNEISLVDVVANVKPTILIGCSTVPNAFNEEIVKIMAAHTEYPIIFPLSNPTDKSEALPVDLIKWTNGKALIATGSPFDPVNYNGRNITIAQCNNAFVYPGIGLGTLATKAKAVSDEMLLAACLELFNETSNVEDFTQPLLPSIKNAAKIGHKIGYAVAQQAYNEKLATVKINGKNSAEISTAIKNIVDDYHWKIGYMSYELV